MKLIVIGCVLFLAGCAHQQPERTLGILTVAVVGNDVMIGREFPYSDGFEMASLTNKSFRCSGQFEQLSAYDGLIHYHCTDGSRGHLRFHIFGRFEGGGSGTSPNGPVQFLYGYPIKAVNARLKFPGGARLEERNGRYVLVNKQLDD